jgi:carboxyl-terminal processing protease
VIHARVVRSKATVVAASLLVLLSVPARAADPPRGTPPRAEATAPRDLDALDKNLVVFTEALGLVRSAYVEETGDGLMAGALDGLTDALDPFSTYVPAERVDGYLEARKVGSGRSGALVLEEHGIAYVAAVATGGPAAAAGVEPGDIVAKIDGRSTRRMPPWAIEELLAGKPGTKLEVELVRQGETLHATLVLWPFTPPPPSLSTVDGVTVLRIPTFDATTAPAVETLLAGAAGATKAGLVVDLRGVSTGDADTAYATAELFADGALGSLTHRKDELRAFASDQAPVWRGRLVVLVDRGTLGAAEVLATVLRQKAGAALVGERTFGHAGRQGSAELSSGGRLFYTEAFYTGPDGKPLLEPLRPDLLVDERSRTLPEKDVPMAELILKRGVHRLLGGEGARP